MHPVMNAEYPPSQDSSSPTNGSLVSRLMNVFVSPGETFAEVAAGPIRHVNWLIPALLLVVASWGAAALMFTSPAIKQQVVEIQDETLQKRFQPQIDSGKMTQTQVDQIKAQAAKFAGISQIVGGFVAPLFQAAITPFWGGFILWAGGCWVFKRPFNYLKGVETVGLTMAIMAVGVLIKGLLCAAMGTLFASPSPILLVKHYDPTNPLHNILITLDVFTLWALLLRVVGLSKLSQISIAKAGAWVIGMWLVLTGGMLGLGWAAQKLGSLISGQH